MQRPRRKLREAEEELKEWEIIDCCEDFLLEELDEDAQSFLILSLCLVKKGWGGADCPRRGAAEPKAQYKNNPPVVPIFLTEREEEEGGLQRVREQHGRLTEIKIDCFNGREVYN